VTGIALAAGIAAGAGAAQAEQLRFMTGPQGGAWYPLGGAIQAIVSRTMPGHSVQVLPGAGIANVKGIDGGKADIGFANSISTVDAVHGRPPFTEKTKDVCNVASFYPQYFQVVVSADSPIKGPADFNGKAGTTQPRGNTGEAVTENLLKALGMTYKDLSKVSFGSYTDSVSLMKDNNADFFTLGTGIPAGPIMDLAASRDVRMIEIDDATLKKMQEINAGYQRQIIKAGTYPKQTQDVKTIGYMTHVVARCSLSEDIVYNLLKGIEANMGDLAAISKSMTGLTAKEMGVDVGVPMHKGAARYYKEKGVM
jgi:hypothetical protein